MLRLPVTNVRSSLHGLDAVGRLQGREHRSVVGEHANLPDHGAGRDLNDLAVENLTLGGEDLNGECVLAGHGGTY